MKRYAVIISLLLAIALLVLPGCSCAGAADGNENADGTSSAADGSSTTLPGVDINIPSLNKELLKTAGGKTVYRTIVEGDGNLGNKYKCEDLGTTLLGAMRIVETPDTAKVGKKVTLKFNGHDVAATYVTSRVVSSTAGSPGSYLNCDRYDDTDGGIYYVRPDDLFVMRYSNAKTRAGAKEGFTKENAEKMLIDYIVAMLGTPNPKDFELTLLASDEANGYIACCYKYLYEGMSTDEYISIFMNSEGIYMCSIYMYGVTDRLFAEKSVTKEMVEAADKELADALQKLELPSYNVGYKKVSADENGDIYVIYRVIYALGEDTSGNTVDFYVKVN